MLFFLFCLGISAVDLEEVEGILTASTILENDDQALHCQICQISFSSLNNKLSHFSGRSHRQSVIEHLHNKLALSTNTPSQTHNRDMTDRAGGKDCQEECEGNEMECSDVAEQLSHVAMQLKGNHSNNDNCCTIL